MEHREIFAVIIAVVMVCIVMAIVSMVRGSSDSQPEISSGIESTVSVPITTTKDIWEQIRDQQETTAASGEQTTAPEAVVSGETTGIVTELTISGSGSVNYSIDTQAGQASAATSSTAESADSTVTTHQPSFNLVIP